MAKERDVVEINLEQWIIPIAIVIAGVLVAAAIYLTNRTKQDDSTVVGTQQEAEAQQEEFPQANTTISDSPYLGDKSKAKVVIVEYTDFLCSYCARHATETKPKLISEYIDSGQVLYVVRNLPLDFHGQLALDIANASLCVNEIGGREKYFEFYTKGFEQESTDTLSATAKELGIDMNKYNTCMNENRYGDTIEVDITDATSAGIQGTPGFVIGKLDSKGNVEGRLIAGAYPFESFKQIIEEYSE